MSTRMFVAIIIFLVLAALGFAIYSRTVGLENTPKLLTVEEIRALPIGTKVWVEYNRPRFDKLPDSVMIREKIDGVGDVIRTPEGYWSLDEKIDFGVTYRVWTRMPTLEQRQKIPFEESPWE